MDKKESSPFMEKIAYALLRILNVPVTSQGHQDVLMASVIRELRAVEREALGKAADMAVAESERFYEYAGRAFAVKDTRSESRCMETASTLKHLAADIREMAKSGDTET